MVYSGFVNTMRQEARMEVLLPIGRNTLEEVSISEHSWDYRYEPSPIAVKLEYLVRRYLESVVYRYCWKYGVWTSRAYGGDESRYR